MENLTPNIGVLYTIGFPACSLVVSIFFINSALTDIKEVGIKSKFYPKHYVVPARWMRRMFGVSSPTILKSSFFQFVLALVYAVYGIASGIIIMVYQYNLWIMAFLFYFEAFSVLVFEAVVIFFSIYYRRKKR